MTSTPGALWIHVVAAAVTDGEGRVLIAQRPPGKQLAGSWEFPGGKLEAGEARRDGLARELKEELGIAICPPRPLMRLRHSYPFGEVLIDMWVVTRYSGEPQGLDGQALRWCTQNELAEADLLPADRPIVRALRLPERLSQPFSDFYEISPSSSSVQQSARTDREDSRLRGAFCEHADDAFLVAGRADFVVLNEALAEGDLRALCDAISEPVYARNIELEAAWGCGASGVNALPPDSFQLGDNSKRESHRGR